MGRDAGRAVGRADDRQVLLCADGPILVPGPVTVEDENGEQHRSERFTVAICRCGASSCRPWCDGSHKQLQRRPRRTDQPAGDRADDPTSDPHAEQLADY